VKNLQVLNYTQESEDFQQAFTQELSKRLDAMRVESISAQNFYRYSHSPNWTYHGPENGGNSSTMDIHSVEMGVRFEDIVLGNDGVIDQQIERATSGFQKQFMQSLYSTVSEACDRVGNVVSYKGEVNFPEAFLAMLNKIEFSIDRDGRPSLPQWHIPADSFEKIMNEMNSQPQSYLDQLERIKALKIQEAYDREVKRISRFRTGN
jgi:hypothetical protein